jgi:formylmethanofuran dehydrogenase subunit C
LCTSIREIIKKKIRIQNIFSITVDDLNRYPCAFEGLSLAKIQNINDLTTTETAAIAVFANVLINSTSGNSSLIEFSMHNFIK